MHVYIRACQAHAHAAPALPADILQRCAAAAVSNELQQLVTKLTCPTPLAAAHLHTQGKASHGHERLEKGDHSKGLHQGMPPACPCRHWGACCRHVQMTGGPQALRGSSLHAYECM